MKQKKKEKYQVEFELKSSVKILYNYISSPSGLSEWFADDVTVQDHVYTFIWGNSEEQAKISSKREPELVRFDWLDKENYFEMEILCDDITSEVALLITDFAFPEEIEAEKKLWESQIQELRHTIGS